MGLIGTRFEFGVVLNSHIKITVVKLNGFNQVTVWRQSRKRKSRAFKHFAEVVVEFVAVAVAFADLLFAVSLCHCGVVADNAWIRSQTKRAALVGFACLAGQIVDYLGHVLSELARICVFKPNDVARELDDRDLHSQADSKVRDPVFPGVARGDYHALDSAVTEAARNDDSVKT